MFNLTGYQISDRIYFGVRTEVYRAIRSRDRLPVAIKVLRNPHPTFNQLVQFRNQYTITKHLKHPHILQPLSLDRYENSYALIMPDKGAIALSNYWQTSDRSLAEFFNIAIQLAEVLHYLNKQQIVHKDIKPANILICPQTHQIKLIDFSISTLLPKEQQQLINPNILEGTLAYISPEQTGRMNRGIDYRSDFYSLGATFYQLLTGQLPFITNDPMELIHCHIAKTPIFPLQGGGRSGSPTHSIVPQVLIDIVLKLMAKNAEDRYQSALGLKHDLEQCLHQLNATGDIIPFEIAQRDLCSHFIIPEKLYGREEKVAQLLDAFNRVASPPSSQTSPSSQSEMMLVAGYSGIGKTAAVNEVHKPIVKKKGYFIKGKFDQFNRHIPFSAFVEAFQYLIEQLLGESQTQLQAWKTKLLDALGTNTQVISDVIPKLKHILGEQPTVTELAGSAAQHRFNLLFQKFIAVFATPEHPLVLFLDDLQWADSASLNLIKLLIAEGNIGNLLLLGAYRDNEVFPAHPLMLTLSHLEKNQAAISTITLQPLAEHHINQLVADTLSCPEDLAYPLTQLIYQKTQGNPFFTTQFLKGLHQDGLIAFNVDLRYWQCDLTRVRDAALTSDVVKFIADRLHNLPHDTQKMLKLAACIGNQFDLETLAIISEQSLEEVAGNLWGSLQEGLLLPMSETYKFFQDVRADDVEETGARSLCYRFLHDRVQQAAYSLIPEGEKKQTHLIIGRRLLHQSSQSQQEQNLFSIVGQLNLGSELIAAQSERDRLAELNWQAAQKAKKSTAYHATFNYCLQGYQLLGDRAGNRHYYLTLNLGAGAAEAAYLQADFESMDRWIDTTMNHAVTVLDRVKLYEIQILSFMAKNQPFQSVKTALEVLGLLGVQLPDAPGSADIEQALQQTTKRLENHVIADLINLPTMTDLNKIAALKILALVIPPTFIAAPVFFPLFVSKQIDFCLDYGNSELAAYNYVLYGFMLCGVTGDFVQGYQFGRLGLKILAKEKNSPLKAKVLMTFYGFISFWQIHLRDGLEPLLEAYHAGLELGDLEYAAYASVHYCFNLLLLGYPLQDVETEVNVYTHFFRQIKLEPIAVKNEILHQTILNVMGQSTAPHCLIGDMYDYRTQLSQHHDAKDIASIAFVHLLQLWLCVLFDRPQEAISHANLAEPHLDALRSTYFIPIFYYYDSLARLAIWNQSERSTQQTIQQRVESNQTKMQGWASLAPMNYQHKWELVEAQKCYLQGDLLAAIDHYDRAIAGAKENGYIQEEALGNELAAKYYLDRGQEKIAAVYMADAYYCYALWGAKAKTDRLETDYPHLLTPIRQQPSTDVNPLDSLESLSQTLASISTETSSRTRISDTLDFSAILQAAQTLSRTINLEDLLADIVQIILTNAGAQKAALLIPQEDRWQLRAIAQITEDSTLKISTAVKAISLESSVPIRLINYVKNSQMAISIESNQTELSGILDGYLIEYQPESVFCIPLLNQGSVVAILYLEHSTTKGVFSKPRQTIIEFLCTQAAISLQNAQLYQQAQNALQDLQQAQLQLVQSEKMSALGNLVAGVAHEINNPTGFLQGNIQPAQDYVQDLLELIDLYQSEYPQKNQAIAQKINDIELEFIRSDLPNLLGSMHQGVKRIRNISKSLRTFSRTDQEQKTTFNLHEGINSTLLILKHRTKANEARPNIKIIKQYGTIPEVECFPGQLNQVFMNLLANAIDAFDEANQGKTYEQIQGNQNCITIRTSAMESNQVRIEIEDNGCGMKAETKHRIFEQGFTTKAVGKGTGLGMAIAYQIISEKHSGTIECDSKLGQGTIFRIAIPIHGLM